MGRPTLPTKSPKRLPGTKTRRRSVNGSVMAGPGASGSLPGSSSTASTSGGSANIKVAVRVRPENEREKAGAYNNVINVVDERMLIFDPKEDQDDFFYQGKKQGRRDLNKRENKDKKFAFDAVFAPGSTNQQVFEGTTKDLVETVFNGYNCSVFAYGATGAGKTFTMLGAKDYPGITFLTMQEIYNKIESLENKSCEIGISYLEVYNETVKDLLAPGALLDIRESGTATMIPGLSIHKPSGPDSILSLLSFGNGNRTQHATDANSESSRSHAVLQVFIKLKDKDAGLSAEVKVAKMSMIDLAGSEKGAVTGNKGARFREGSNINKSLLALGNCINALADGAKYIPYRNSKLTRLLKDSIGGNCRTVMIANVSPSSETFEDTFNTLKYADRAKKIKISLKKNVLNVDLHVAQYAKVVEDLRGEIAVLKKRIQELENENQTLKSRGGSVETRTESTPTSEMEVDSTNSEDVSPSTEIESNTKEIEKLQKTLNRYIERQQDYDELQRKISEFEQRAVDQSKEIEALKVQCQSGGSSASSERVSPEELVACKSKVKELEEKLRRKEADKETSADNSRLDNLVNLRKTLVDKLLNEQSALVNLKMRIHFKKQLHERNEKITIGQKDVEKSEVKTSKAVQALDKKVERKSKRVDQLIEDINRNKAELSECFENNPQDIYVKNAHLEIQLLESKAESRHLFSMISTLGSKLETQDQDLNATLRVLRKNHLYLRGHDLASQADQQEYEDLRDQLLEARLRWASGGQLTEYSDQTEAELLAVNFYSEAAQLSLPSLDVETIFRPKSAEQRELFGAPEAENTVIIETGPQDDDTAVDSTPPPCKSEKAFLRSSSSTTFPSLPPTPNLVSTGEELLPPTPRVFGNNSFEILPPTPQLELNKPAPLLRKESDKSFTQTENSVPPLLKSAVLKAAASTIASSPQSTPKRLSGADHQEGSAQKKPRVEADINWAVHRESGEIPDTPVSSRKLNETFSPESPGQAGSSSLNETVTLSLNKQCGIKSPEPEPERKNLNSTFAIEDEPMDVDHTNTRSLPFVGDMSVIQPPKTGARDFLSVKADQSPVKAGMDTPVSPRDSAARPPRRSPRNSTMPPPTKPGSGKKPWQSGTKLTPQNGGKPVKRTLKHSVSASVLPKQQSSSQPISFRSTINRLHQGVGPGQVKKQAGALTKENPAEKPKFSTVGNKINSGLGKLKKSVSSANVLKTNNKQ